VKDHLGSVTDVIDAQGKRIGELDYGPYGKDIKAAGQVTDFRYAGMFYLPETGLYLTHYRLYDPDAKRWLNRDPIGEVGGLNLYAYVEGNPVNSVDPTGECPWCVAAGIGALTDFIIQLYFNGFNLKCINWTEVAISGAAAGVGIGIAQKLSKVSTVYGGANRPTHRFFQSKGNVRVESHPISKNSPGWYSYPHWHPDLAGKPWSKIHWPLIEPMVGLPATVYNATKDDCECQK
jgi:RHS repeat-associated protein